MDQDIKEIDILDLIFYCLERWRTIVIFMLLFAVIMNGLQYKTDIKSNQEQITTDVEDEKEPINPVVSVVKNSAIGLILGAILACLILTLKYMPGRRLQDIKDFKGEFGIPLVGIVREMKTKRSLFDFIDRWIMRLEDGPYADITSEEQMEIAVANVEAAIYKNLGGIENKKIMVAGTMAEKDMLPEYSNLKAKMKEVDLSAYKQLVLQSSAIRELRGFDGILFMEKKGKSPISLIKIEREMAKDRNVKILGGIVFI